MRFIVTPKHDVSSLPSVADNHLRVRLCNSPHKKPFRWRKLLETGAYGTIEELAEAEKINPSYISRVLRMTLLAPDIVEAVLKGTPLA